MRLANTIAAIPLLALAAACTPSGAGYQPVIDGPVGPNYSSDLAACQSLAARQGALSSGAAGNAAAGAVLSGGAAAIVRNEGNTVRDAALLGAAAGLTGSALEQQRRKEAIISNCMRQRGYRVVG
jgi:hypothetical protein